MRYPLERQELAPPQETSFPRRHLFHPKTGWFRRTERETNRWLSRNLFPRLPGIRWPYARILERGLVVSEGEVELSGLAGAPAGIRVLLVSDFHAGPFVTPRVLARTIDRLMTLEPDLILAAGDFATVTVEEVERALPAFGHLSAPLGVYGVLGNHDYYTGDTDRLCHLLGSVGIEFLHNRSVTIRKDSARFLLAGVDDLLGGEPCLDTALEGQPDGVPTVVVSHNPDVFPEAVDRGVTLMLAGHTHGGQIRAPGFSVLVRMSRYHLDHGRYRAGSSELIVTRGLGVTGLPIRWACPPEAMLITLRPPNPCR